MNKSKNKGGNVVAHTGGGLSEEAPCGWKTFQPERGMAFLVQASRDRDLYFTLCFRNGYHRVVTFFICRSQSTSKRRSGGLVDTGQY